MKLPDRLRRLAVVVAGFAALAISPFLFFGFTLLVILYLGLGFAALMMTGTYGYWPLLVYLLGPVVLGFFGGALLIGSDSAENPKTLNSLAGHCLVEAEVAAFAEALGLGSQSS